MTIQKAMRVRAGLRKEISALNMLVHNASKEIVFRDRIPDPEELKQRREEKTAALDGMSYGEALSRLFALTEVIEELNTAIEIANREGHILLYREAGIKARISFVDYQIETERRIVQKEEQFEIDFENRDNKGNCPRTKVMIYRYPILPEEYFGMSLAEYRKRLTQELEEIRDKLSEFNASAKVDYVLPPGIL